MSGKARADIVAGARIEPLLAAARDELHADAVPFPFGEIVARDRARRGRRPRAAAPASAGQKVGSSPISGGGRAAFEPSEQRPVGRREAVPDLLDAIELDAAPFGERGLGEPRRDADPQRAGDELQQRPAAGRVERVEPRREMRPDLGAARRPAAARRSRGGSGTWHSRPARRGSGQISATVSARSPTKS